MYEEKQILDAYNNGIISKEEKDKLLNDITPLLWQLLMSRANNVS